MREAQKPAHKAKGRTRCSASCLAHKPPKGSHQSQAHRPQRSPWLVFALFVHPLLVYREKKSLAHLVLRCFHFKTLAFFWFQPHPCPPTPFATKQSTSTIFVFLALYPSPLLSDLRRNLPESLSVWVEVRTLFLAASTSKGYIFRRLCSASVGSWFSSHHPRQALHSEREAFSYHLAYIFHLGKNNNYILGLDAQQSSKGKRIQPTYCAQQETFFLFDHPSGHNKNKSRHKSRIGTSKLFAPISHINNDAQKGIEVASLILSNI